MARPLVLPFQIQNVRFEDSRSSPELDAEAHDMFARLIHVATHEWLRKPWISCDSGDQILLVQRRAPFRTIEGVWVLYQIEPIGSDPLVVSAKPGPMYSGIGSVRHPNAEHDQTLENRIDQFWRRNFQIMHRLLDAPLELDDGTALVVDHWRFPTAEAGDPEQHEWVNVAPFFDLYSDRVVTFDLSRGKFRARKMVKKQKPRGGPNA